MASNFSRQVSIGREVQPAAIVGVDLVTRTAQAAARDRTVIDVNAKFSVGETTVVPAVGEQWYIERIEREWRLCGRIPFNDPTLLIEPVEGMVSVGGGRGPVDLHGTEIRTFGPLKIGDTFYRDTAGVLESSPTSDGMGWTPVVPVRPYDVHYVHSLGSVTRIVGAGASFGSGWGTPRAVVFTSVTYRATTADASGNLVVELRKNGTTVAGTSVTIAAASQVAGGTISGSWSFAAGDVLTVYVTAVGTTPGAGLVADLTGSVA